MAACGSGAATPALPALPLLVLADPDVPPMSAASIASEIIDDDDVERSATSRTFVRAGSPHDSDQGPGVIVAVLPSPDDRPAPPPDARSRVVDVDGRSMTVTPETEDSITVEATTPDGTPFGLGSLNVPEAELLELAADVIWTGDRFSFASGDVPPGWLDAGTTLTAMSFFAGASGTSTPAGGARITYGTIPPEGMTPDTDAVTLTTWAASAPDPSVEARYLLDREQERVIDIGGRATTVYTGSSEFVDYVVWNDAGLWIALSSPSRTTDELTAFARNVRRADPAEIAAINALAS